MNISEIEKLTGISKQTIRFYEREGLISPKRNQDNQYREYDNQDVRKLKLIYILRKTGISISEIKRVLDGEITMTEAVNVRRKELLGERKEQDDLLEFCDDLKMQSVKWIDVDKYVEKIQQEEKKGNKIFEVLEEYKQVFHGEWKKEFVFRPESFVENPREFTEELLRYAKENNADITITKESMYPEFILNGVEYTAVRIHTRHGASIRCKMKYPELAEPENVIGTKKKVMKLIARWLPGVCIVALLIILTNSYAVIPIGVGILVTGIIAYVVGVWYPNQKYKK